jgi:hypothetical protein
MTRIQTLASRPKRTLGALAVVLAAVGITVGSGANFNATKANAGTFAAGKLSIGNELNKTIFASTDMKPGDSDSGTVDVTNTGTVSGDFYLSQAIAPARAGKPEDTALLNRLQLTVTDCGDATAYNCSTPVGGAPVYTGPMTGFTSQTALRKLAGSQAKWPAGEAHHFKFDVVFPDGNNVTPAVPDGADNAAQGGQVSATYTWKATS